MADAAKGRVPSSLSLLLNPRGEVVYRAEYPVTRYRQGEVVYRAEYPVTRYRQGEGMGRVYPVTRYRQRVRAFAGGREVDHAVR